VSGMDWKRAIWNRSLVARILLALMLAMVPLYLIGIGIYNWGIGAVQSEIVNSKTQQTSAYLSSLENEVRRIKTLQSEFLVSTEINKLSFAQFMMDDYTKFDLMLRLRQQIKTIKRSSSLILDAVAYLPRLGKTISADNGVADFTEADAQRMKVTDNRSQSQIAFMEDQVLINQGFPTSMKPSYSIMVVFSSDAMQSELDQFNTFEGSGTILVSRPIGIALSAGGSEESTVEAIRRLDTEPGSKGVVRHKMSGGQYLLVFERSEYLGLTICQYIPNDQILAPLLQYQFWFWLFTLASAIIIGLFAYSIHTYIQRPIQKLIGAFQRMETGDMDFEIRHRYDDEIENLYRHFNDMVSKLNRVIKHEYLQEILVKRAELKQLQAQINPHFLYNSFFILYTMTRRGEYGMLEKFELQLGDYYQFLTRNTSDEVTLAKEVNHARTYCEIQALRFSNRITIDFGELPEEYADMQVPRLILQPIIENAFVHGLEMKEEGGRLFVGFTAEGAFLRISIQDNGGMMTDEEILEMNRKMERYDNNTETTSMLNIHRRIRLRFGDRCGLTFARGGEGGLEVTLILGRGGA
jgi:two-component system sensor histidine kinase YesM